MIEKSELEKEVTRRMKEIADLKQQNEELEEYYASKWTRDYNRVREQLAKDSQKKFD